MILEQNRILANKIITDYIYDIFKRYKSYINFGYDNEKYYYGNELNGYDYLINFQAHYSIDKIFFKWKGNERMVNVNDIEKLKETLIMLDNLLKKDLRLVLRKDKIKNVL